jgi:DNA (cytosine-5)-methyltransferase 1
VSGLTFGSVCSGIEAASVAWHPLGWRAAWLAEIEPFPSAVLAHHYPDVPNLGDMTRIAAMVRAGEVAAPDVLVGGTPCQAFSVAGLRRSLDDARGQLSLAFVDLANAIDAARSVRGEPAAIIVWENVPGVLTTADNAFGCFLAGLAGEDEALVPPGKKWANAGCVYGPQRTVAWRITDAQFFGVAQRRRRVFVVASAREDFDPGEVLLEFDGVRRDTAPSRQAGQDPAAGPAHGARIGSHWDGEFPHPTLNQSTTGASGIGMSNQALFSQRGAYLVDPALADRWPADLASTLNASFGSKLGLEDQHIRSGAPLFVLGTPPVAGTLDTQCGGQKLTHQTILNGHVIGTITARMFNALGARDVEEGALLACVTQGGGFGQFREAEVSSTLRADGGDQGGGSESLAAYAFQPRIARNGRGDMGDLVNALTAQAGETGKGDAAPCVAYAIQAGATRVNPASGPDGVGVQEAIAYTLEARAEVQAVAFSCKDSGADASVELAPTLRAMGYSGSHANGGGQMAVCVTGEITHTLKADGFDASEDGTGRGQPIVAAFAENSRAELRLEGGDGSRTGALSTGGGKPGQGVPMVFTGDGIVADPLSANEAKTYTHEGSTFRLHNCIGQPVTATSSGRGWWSQSEVGATLRAQDSPIKADTLAATSMAVRRLTPRECERLQAFPDDYTLIPWTEYQRMQKRAAKHGTSFEEELRKHGKPLRGTATPAECPDGPRYKALGNSMCVNNMRWIGQRIMLGLSRPQPIPDSPPRAGFFTPAEEVVTA